jgi:hypothetical protein
MRFSMKWLAILGALCGPSFPAAGVAVPWQASNPEKAFGLTAHQVAKTYTVQEIGCGGVSNVFWPGEEVRFALQFVNQTDRPLQAHGKAEVIQYRMISDPADVWVQTYDKVADCGAVPVHVDIAPKGFADVTVRPVQPRQFGAYVLVIDLAGQGRQFAAAYLYVPKAVPGKFQYPAYAMDIQATGDEMCGLFQRLGIKGTRIELGYSRTNDPGFAKRMADWAQMFNRLNKYDITTLVTLEGGDYGTMPLGRIRSFLNDQAEGNMQYPGDFTWLPQYDDDYQKFVSQLSAAFGWPKGPVNAVELWNEPWEGISISGWGADLPRYREIYTKMALGVEDARRKAGVQVLLGGACSSANTEDKLFCDGKDTFLKWLDFTSIHYQPLGNVPALIPAWVQRKHPNGPVQSWDTESWIANSEDKVAAVIASMRAQGLSRTAGVLHDKVRSQETYSIRTAKGTQQVTVIQAWSPGAGIAATQHYIGQRPFKELLFENGLPWIFVFDGLAGDPDDGTVVVVGDLGGVYERELCKFRSVFGLANRAKVTAIEQQLAALPPGESKQRTDLTRALRAAQILTGAGMTFPSQGGMFQLFDFYGNPVDDSQGKITVPLNGLGYFLRTCGQPGSFAKLLDALRAARIEGYEPIEIQASDMTAVVDGQPELKLTLTNILNRPVTGKLIAKLGNLTLDAAEQNVSFAPHETKVIPLKVVGGAANDSNIYPLSAAFDAGKDGKSLLNEDLHVNLIAKRSIKIDGKLDDWKGVLPHTVKSGGGGGPGLTEKAWLPFVNFPEKLGAGLAIAYLACDDKGFYFAAKISDSTPDGGQVRYATRDDDQYYYPEKCWQVDRDKDGKVTKRTELTWPAGVRRFSYRKNPDLPFTGDAVQLAFNVLPQEKKGLYAFPPGTMERFMVYKDTDYEYYLHQVGAKWGGGTEIWRLLAPGVPRKHYYPRQPKAEKDGGPVSGGQLAVVQEGGTRVVECALPWSEIPDVKTALGAGKSIRFSFRVTDDKGQSYELANGRSVSKLNPLTFHGLWQNHWSNEVEFGAEK